jgi:hypothetical protein
LGYSVVNGKKCEAVEWMHLAQHVAKWQAVVNKVMTRTPIKAAIL